MTSQQLRPQPEIEHLEDVDTITFTGRKIGGEDSLIARELIDLTKGSGNRPLLLDFRNIECVISSDWGKLITLHKKMKAAGGQLTLVNVNPSIGEILEITMLNKFFEVRKEDNHRLASTTFEGYEHDKSSEFAV